MKPSHGRDRVAIVAHSILAVAALVLVVLADRASLRIAMVLLTLSAALGIGLAAARLRRQR